MDRRCFDFLYAEICVALDRRVSRYGLWLLVSERFDGDSTVRHDWQPPLIDDCIDAFLVMEDESLSPKARRRLERRLVGFDPRFPTPEEWLLGLANAAHN